ncbi:MAG: ADP-ribosylglycohydrolase family protein [Rhodoferax sp.]|uniref:ADP-ribosylglycohydrolase family protein n=1 Tax=Rhodoferax sp. TaxID=50421 RepID=UPI002ACDC463|nr:ADP-ribosylglycohydrolase family protein [Rhodoferax sp.]MDZ7890874.1 ADP-ribosylglycohydrolase family protein [Rhodoferax sp.]
MKKPVVNLTLLDQAQTLVAQHHNASVAFLQRMLKLEYATASALMRALEGTLVTPPNAQGCRSMLTSPPPKHESPMNMNDRILKAQGAMLGLAIGDAIGTSVEFSPRGSFTPVSDMVGGGVFGLQPGQWTDDTSMALCLAASLLEHGFDIGGTTSDALERYRRSGTARAGSTDPNDAGNGSIMRLAPVVLFFQDTPADAIRYAVEQSKTTHRAPECLVACQLMAETMLRALQGESKDAVLAPSKLNLACTPGLQAIATGAYLHKTVEAIRGTGYVVQSLEAALWSFATTIDYRSCVLAATNLGDDADTTAAVAGQIAGAFYGANGIPQTWKDRVHLGAQIAQMAAGLVSHEPA